MFRNPLTAREKNPHSLRKNKIQKKIAHQRFILKAVLKFFQTPKKIHQLLFETTAKYHPAFSHSSGPLDEERLERIVGSWDSRGSVATSLHHQIYKNSKTNFLNVKIKLLSQIISLRFPTLNIVLRIYVIITAKTKLKKKISATLPIQNHKSPSPTSSSSGIV